MLDDNGKLIYDGMYRSIYLIYSNYADHDYIERVENDLFEFLPLIKYTNISLKDWQEGDPFLVSNDLNFIKHFALNPESVALCVFKEEEEEDPTTLVVGSTAYNSFIRGNEAIKKILIVSHAIASALAGEPDGEEEEEEDE